MTLPLEAAPLLAFIICVAVASTVQSLTTFAFGLVLLGLVGVLQVFPLADATNASIVIALGLFATYGPPMVYRMLRQPFDPSYIRRRLVLVFIANNMSRLFKVTGTGQLPFRSLVLCAIALPAPFVTTRITSRNAAHLSRPHVVLITGILLCATGAALVTSAERATS